MRRYINYLPYKVNKIEDILLLDGWSAMCTTNRIVGMELAIFKVHEFNPGVILFHNENKPDLVYTHGIPLQEHTAMPHELNMQCTEANPFHKRIFTKACLSNPNRRIRVRQRGTNVGRLYYLDDTIWPTINVEWTGKRR